MSQPNLTEDPVQKLFFKYLAPSISATLVTSIYILADTVMIGRGVGAIGIAALNLLLPLFSLYFGTGMLFGVGGGVLLSISKGRGDEKSAREYFTMALICAVAASAVYVVGCHLFFAPLTGFLGRTESMSVYVEGYGRILVSGAPVFLFSAFLQAFVRNDKAPKLAMIAVVTGGISNVILDYVFIFPFGMGMAGGAIASVIGSCLTLLILLSHFLSPSNTLKITSTLSLRKCREIFDNGVPSFLVELSNGIVVFLFNRQLLVYAGELGVVVYGIISNSTLIVASIGNGIAQAAQPILATNFGAGKGERVMSTRKLGEAAAAVAGLLFLAVGVFAPQLVIGVFVRPTEEIIRMAVPAVRIYFVSYLAVGLNILYSTYFQSTMKSGIAMVICMLRGIILNGILVLILPLAFGVTGIWMTIVAAEFMTLAVCLLLTWRRDNRIYDRKTDI